MIDLIRPTTLSDLPRVMELYDIARNFMRQNGNTGQWINGYPTESYISEEIAAGHSFVCENEAGKIVGTFCFIMGDDPTYRKIYEGRWLNDAPYGAVHRIASSGEEKGVARACFDWCFRRIATIRVDTHPDNTVMQNVLRDYGFTYCGIIYVTNGTSRFAYQLTK
ncbi:MAG: GNAT family protein [Petrimonas sp.]|nr:GNAT family protein [Petrimonas sp.]